MATVSTIISDALHVVLFRSADLAGLPGVDQSRPLKLVILCAAPGIGLLWLLPPPNDDRKPLSFMLCNILDSVLYHHATAVLEIGRPHPQWRGHVTHYMDLLRRVDQRSFIQMVDSEIGTAMTILMWLQPNPFARGGVIEDAHGMQTWVSSVTGPDVRPSRYCRAAPPPPEANEPSPAQIYGVDANALIL